MGAASQNAAKGRVGVVVGYAAPKSSFFGWELTTGQCQVLLGFIRSPSI